MRRLAAAIFVLCAAASIGGCDSASTAGPGGKGGSSAGGSTGSGGSGSGAGGAGQDAGTGGAGAGGSGAGPRACSPTPGGCLCADATSASGAACSATSVAMAGQQGSCCDQGGLCSCNAYACKFDPAQEYCSCGIAVLVGMTITGGSAVSECPAPTAAQKCCLSMAGDRCDCLPVTSCDTGSTQVTSCSRASVTPCQMGAQVTSCN